MCGEIFSIYLGQYFCDYFCTRYTHFAHNTYILHTALFSSLVNIEMFLSLKVKAANDIFPLLGLVQDGTTVAITSVPLV